MLKAACKRLPTATGFEFTNHSHHLGRLSSLFTHQPNNFGLNLNISFVDSQIFGAHLQPAAYTPLPDWTTNMEAEAACDATGRIEMDRQRIHPIKPSPKDSSFAEIAFQVSCDCPPSWATRANRFYKTVSA